eukprot:CAMPEP_0117447966 /NCGR_PEP_ID=MMETSP0759-20121206/7149_1 /TAXON_ID=63605 /ORGANISM="Percolomonas cosmopolitus, Strain WS" /LENGTH=61 /DNA_ID=CAMNT_0005240321 /DNA_START=406 /DNA_END=591 /DNA_ORIENTATION=-
MNVLVYRGLGEIEEKMLDACFTSCATCAERCKHHKPDHCQKFSKACAGVTDAIKSYRSSSH